MQAIPYPTLVKALEEKNICAVIQELTARYYTIDDSQAIFKNANSLGLLEVVQHCVDIGLKNKIIHLIPRLEKVNLDYLGALALKEALELGYVQLVNYYLLKKVPLPVSRDLTSDKIAFFSYAAKNNHFDMVTYWVKTHKVPAESQDSLALFKALAEGRYDMAHHLVSLGANIRHNPSPKYFDIYPANVLKSTQLSDDTVMTIVNFYIKYGIRYEQSLSWLVQIAKIKKVSDLIPVSGIKRVEFILEKNIQFQIEDVEKLLEYSFKSSFIFRYFLKKGFDPTYADARFIVESIHRNFAPVARLLLIEGKGELYPWIYSTCWIERVFTALADNTSLEFRKLTSDILRDLGYRPIMLDAIGDAESDWWLGQEARSYTNEVLIRHKEGPRPNFCLLGEKIRLIYLEQKLEILYQEKELKVFDPQNEDDSKFLKESVINKVNINSHSDISKTIANDIAQSSPALVDINMGMDESKGKVDSFSSILEKAEQNARTNLIDQAKKWARKDGVVELNLQDIDVQKLSSPKLYFVWPHIQKECLINNIKNFGDSDNHKESLNVLRT